MTAKQMWDNFLFYAPGMLSLSPESLAASKTLFYAGCASVTEFAIREIINSDTPQEYVGKLSVLLQELAASLEERPKV